MKRTISRRSFLKSSGCYAGAVALNPLINSLAAPYLKNNSLCKKVIVLGIDGMDPVLLERFIAAGHLPTFAKLAKQSGVGRLRTTMPPHTPVAWSSFISGTNPGGNGIYDFIHRDPETFTPHLSISRSFDAQSSLSIGSWKIPLAAGRVESLRRGPTLWGALEGHEIDSTIFQIPANFPVTTVKTKAISGLGTPDLIGSYGSYTFFTEEAQKSGEHREGGRTIRIYPLNHVATTALPGPRNSFKVDQAHTKIPFTILRDPKQPTLRVKLQDHDIILRQGEWTDWLPVSFPLLEPLATVNGMVRLFAKEVHPRIKLYVSPINVDPLDPILPISSPPSYSKELASQVGRFYTQGFPSDTNALSHGVFSDEDYFEQAKWVIEENMRSFEHQFSKFNAGFFFFYFSSIDQNSHMLWRLMDPTHPLHRADASPELKNGLLYFYKRMDDALRRALEKVDDHTLFIAMSDHGFAPFYRQFNLSTWLVENGFTVLTDKRLLGQGEFYQHVDWSKTSAYALGLNGLYLNLRGREQNGSVDAKDADRVKSELSAKLALARDPLKDTPIVTAAYDSSKIYSGPFVSSAPDLMVGYHCGYRISDQAALGGFPQEIVEDRIDAWAADHCIDPGVVPGVLLSNRPWLMQNPALWDMAPTIISAFGITPPKEMEGRSIYT